MHYTTRAIVLQSVKYSESSLIVRMYTEGKGLKSFMIRGAFKPKAKIRAAVVQQMNLVELVASGRDRQGLHHIREIRAEYPYQSLPYDIRKSSVCLFINEMLCRAIRHEEPDAALFAFLRNSLQWFDETKDVALNFHLWLCLHLTRFLGFYPSRHHNRGLVFNLMEGTFQQEALLNNPCIEPPDSAYFESLLNCTLEELPAKVIPQAVRSRLVLQIINYYKLHINDFGEIRSAKVLAEVLG